MAIPGPGQAISINSIVTEFGGSAPHAISEYYRGGPLVANAPVNAAIPTSGQIALSNFYGASNRIAIPLPITGSVIHYNVYNNRGPTYVPGISDITVTVGPTGVVTGSVAVGYAMIVPNQFSPTDTVTIVNNGIIAGAGGDGGVGGPASSVVYPGFPTSPTSPLAVSGTPGVKGANAVNVNRPVTITNNGTIAGGGGGGGGGAGRSGANASSPVKASPVRRNVGGGGGGGGAGLGFAIGGGVSGGTATMPTPLTNTATAPGFAGSNGSPSAGGAGGPARPVAPLTGGAGGAGGSVGASGSPGTAGSGTMTRTVVASGGTGGAPGNYIVGNPFVTWPATGTRLGGVA
jgi:hypothetical protein